MLKITSFPARMALAITSGAVYALAYPPLGWGWLVFFGFGGLLVCLQGEHGTRARTLGFLHGMTAYGMSLSWLYHLFGGMTVVLWAVLAVFTALFAEMQSRAALRGILGWKLAVFTAINWGGWEFIRAELFPLKFPWMTVGLALGPNHLLPWIGVYGVSVLGVLAVALMMLKSRTALFIGVMVLMPFAFRPVDAPLIANDPLAVKVGGLQLENVSLTEYLKGTAEFPSDVEYVVWPEYAIPYDLRANQRDWALVRKLCQDRKITLTLGTQSRPAAGNEWRNIALTLDPESVLGEHTKVHTVHLFDDGIAGTTALPVQTKHGKVGTPICFDCDYEGIVRKMTAAGAELFIVPMMDAATWTARQQRQHAELFRIRACENGRWMFVCGTSGVSQIISPSGTVQARLESLKQGPLIGSMKRETRLTFYTRFGWLVPWCVLGVAAVGWAALLWPVRPSAKEARQTPL